VNPLHMPMSSGGISKCLIAPRIQTLMGLLAGVGIDMSLQVSLLRERFSTAINSAEEKFDVQMHRLDMTLDEVLLGMIIAG